MPHVNFPNNCSIRTELSHCCVSLKIVFVLFNVCKFFKCSSGDAQQNLAAPYFRVCFGIGIGNDCVNTTAVTVYRISISKCIFLHVVFCGVTVPDKDNLECSFLMYNLLFRDRVMFSGVRNHNSELFVCQKKIVSKNW